MIDDGPFTKLLLHRSVKRFDLDMANWPYPPERGGEQWATYWNYRVEEAIFRTGLLVRKLIEADKLSIQAQSRRLTVSFAPLRGERIPDKMNYHHLERFYELGDGERDVEISVVKLCHALVHSFVLVPQFELSPMHGLRFDRFYLASDHDRRKGVFIVSWSWFTSDFVRSICLDDVVLSLMERLPNGEYVQLTSCRHDVSLPELVVAYCELSEAHRKKYERLLRHVEGQGEPWRSLWPSLEEARTQAPTRMRHDQ